MYLSPVTLPPPCRPSTRLAFPPMALLLLSLLLLSHTAPAQASVPASHTYYIALTGSDSGPGTLSQPFLTIQHGVNAAVSGDTVIVEDGTYTGAGNCDIDFGGKNITVTSQNGAASTILDCQGSASANHRGFYLHSGETLAAVVSGLTIKNGYEIFAGNDFGGGGGILLLHAGLTISNCTFTGNASEYGGGVFSGASTVAVSNCTLSGNRVFSPNIFQGMNPSGGGIELNQCTGTVSHCILSGNTAGGVYDVGFGGGIHDTATQSTSVITNCTLTGNTAALGGGIYNDVQGTAKVAVTNCALVNNSGGFGGGIGNSVGYGSPATPTVTVTSCSFTGNSASRNGGGVDIDMGSGAVTVTDCTFSANSASFTVSTTLGLGGGISIYGSDGLVTVTNSTFIANAASNGGGGIDNLGGARLTVFADNDVLYGDAGGEVSNPFGTLSTTYCDIQGGYAGIGNIDADPLFVNAAAGDYHLMPASPCAGAGTSSAPAYLPYTQDNQPRPNPPSIGAFEVSTARLVLTNIAISRSGGTVTVTAKIQNYGNADATAVQITQARLGTTAASAPLPGPYVIPAGGVQVISLTFTTNITGRKPFSIQGVSNGPSFSAGQFLTVP